MKIKQKGFKEHSKHYKKIEKRLQGKLGDPLMKAVQQGAIKVQSIAQAQYLSGPRPQKLGVISGRLWGSITAKSDRKGNTITGKTGTNVMYGPKHEFGINVKKRPFLGPALKDSTKFIQGRIDRALKEVYKK